MIEFALPLFLVSSPTLFDSQVATRSPCEDEVFAPTLSFSGRSILHTDLSAHRRYIQVGDSKYRLLPNPDEHKQRDVTLIGVPQQASWREVFDVAKSVKDLSQLRLTRRLENFPQSPLVETFVEVGCDRMETGFLSLCEKFHLHTQHRLLELLAGDAVELELARELSGCKLRKVRHGQQSENEAGRSLPFWKVRNSRHDSLGAV